MTATETSLEIVDGNIERVGDSPLTSRVRSLPVAGALLNWQPIRHAGSARKLGALVREFARFAVADLLGLDGVRRYHLRRGGRPVLLRHGTVDVWTFAEIFLLRLYEPPPAVAARLAAADSPLVLDIGANIGMFGLDVLVRHPSARIVGYEPDAENAAIHRRLIEVNHAREAWSLVEACAGPADATVTFLPGLETGSRMVDEAVAGTVEVPMVDVMPLLGEADLVKLDIEGGEWAMLQDPRFAAARAVVLEYHPHGCPGEDTEATVLELLRGHGFDVVPLFHEPRTRVGMLWAIRGD